MILLLRRSLIPILNLSMRGLTLVGRFALTIYITRYLGFDAMGEYGLVVGALAMLPAFIGFALNYRVNREIIGEPLDIAVRKVRDRMTISLIMALAVTLVGVAINGLGLIHLPKPALIIALIIIGECLAFDMHYSLISLNHPIAANVLLFIRTSLWVFAVAGLGVLVPAFRTLDMVWYGWLAGILTYFAGLWFIVRSWPLRTFQVQPLDRNWLTQHVAAGGLIYFNDMCVVGTMFSDRFIINHFLGLNHAGRFVYLMSFGYSIYNLCFTSISQIYMPKFVAAIKKDDLKEWQSAIKDSSLLSLAFSLAGSVAVFGLLWLLQRQLNMGSAQDLFVLFPLICLLNIVKVQSDTINYGIYSTGNDKALSHIIILGFILSSAFMAAGILIYQEIGLVAGLLVAAIIIMIIRIAYLKRYVDAYPNPISS